MALAAAQKVTAQPVQLPARAQVLQLELAWQQALVLQRVQALELARVWAQLLVRVLELARVRAPLLVRVLELARVWAPLLVRVLELARVWVSKSVQPWDPEHLQLLFLDHEPESLLVRQRVRGPPWKHLQVLQEQRPLV